jgi:signal transduction histidine kinase
MMRWNPFNWPIRWQISLLLVITQVLAHIATTTAIDLSMSRNGGGRGELALSSSEPLITALRLVTDLRPEDQEARFLAISKIDPRFQVISADEAGAQNFDARPRFSFSSTIVSVLPVYWASRTHVYVTEDGRFLPIVPLERFSIAIELPSGAWLNFEPKGNALVQNIPYAVALLGLLILALPLMFLSLWAGSALVAPISGLARGAERFGISPDAPDLPENGPVEVRQATRSFNRMRQRIRKLMSDRSQTLASIGHDMRTPLTRLRLRLELLSDDEVARAIEADVRVLERMIDDALTFLRSESRPLAIDRIDLAVLARTIADDYADRGHAIVYRGPARLPVAADHDLLLRALDNVVGNAAKFATEATVEVVDLSPKLVRVDVRDNGPGIPLDHHDKVLEPFARIESVRSGAPNQAEGFGLGLAIARDLVERHGGTLGLSDNTPAGLVVSMTLSKQAVVPVDGASHDR